MRFVLAGSEPPPSRPYGFTRYSEEKSTQRIIVRQFGMLAIGLVVNAEGKNVTDVLAINGVYEHSATPKRSGGRARKIPDRCIEGP